MRTLFVSDLDGTLLDAEGRLSNRTRTVLRRMEEEGELITYATARSIQSARIVTEGWMPALPVIVYNGTMLVENETGEPAVFGRSERRRFRRWSMRLWRGKRGYPGSHPKRMRERQPILQNGRETGVCGAVSRKKCCMRESHSTIHVLGKEQNCCLCGSDYKRGDAASPLFKESYMVRENGGWKSCPTMRRKRMQRYS